MKTFLIAFGLVALAELGDKTQLFAMTMAARHSWRPVLAAIVLAALALMGIAVGAGQLATSLLPPAVIKGAGGLLFLFFGVQACVEYRRCGCEEEKPRWNLSPFWMTFLTFFVCELGDKTQLMTIAIAAERGSPLATWAGASAALIAVDGAAVFLGNRLSRRLSRRTLCLVSAPVFFLFGALSILSIFWKDFP